MQRWLLVVVLSSLAMVVSSVYPYRRPYPPFNRSAEHVYNPSTEKCCGGSVFTKIQLADSSLQKCCGTKSIDSTLQLCCDGVVQENKGGQACCRNTTYDPHSSLCCNGKVIPVPKEEIVNAFCCGDVYTCRKTHLCCGGRTVVQKKSGHDQCCGMSDAYNPNTEICCSNFGRGLNVSQPTVIPKDKDSNKSLCCHGKAFDPKERVCCGSGLAPAGSSCCGDKDFDRKTEACCYSTKGFEVLKKAGAANACCEDKLYNPENQICCGGNVTDVPNNSGSQFRCCGREAYDTRGKLICMSQFAYRLQKTVLVEKSAARDFSFCGERGEQWYNTTTQMCCNNRNVIEKPDKFANQCCGDKAYSWSKGTCCRKGNESKYYEGQVGCCGLDKIDLTTQICCAEKSQAKSPSTACCGMKRSYDTETHICCGQNVIAKNKEGQTECCFYGMGDNFNPVHPGTIYIPV